jgi:predicted DNA-binding WGR domain protein
MEKRDPAKNLLRFYEVDSCVTLFGDAAVVRRWGRIGAHGRIEYQWCSSPEEAEQERLRSIERKQHRGYAVIGSADDAAIDRR